MYVGLRFVILDFLLITILHFRNDSMNRLDIFGLIFILYSNFILNI